MCRTITTDEGPNTESLTKPFPRSDVYAGTWAPASVAVSPGSNMNRTLMTNESLRRQRRPTEAMSDLNATSRTNRTDDPHNYDKNSTLNRTAQSNTSRVSETPSMYVR